MLELDSGSHSVQSIIASYSNSYVISIKIANDNNGRVFQGVDWIRRKKSNFISCSLVARPIFGSRSLRRYLRVSPDSPGLDWQDPHAGPELPGLCWVPPRLARPC